MRTILQTVKLCKTYSSTGVQQHVLKNLDLEIYEGDFTVIMGASGAGKSTLLYAMAGMDKPTLGEISYREVQIGGLTEDELAVFRRKNCGFVFQQIYLIDKMSVLDNVLVNGLLANQNKKEVVELAEKLLLEVGLTEEFFHKFPSQLSGGEQQRAAIVRGLINRPRILFADEPTGALNSASADMVLDILTAMNGKGQNIVLVTHDIKTALRGSRVIYLKDGVICGERRMSAFGQETDLIGRRQKLEAFLQEMEW